MFMRFLFLSECPPFDQAPLPDGYPNDCVYWWEAGTQTIEEQHQGTRLFNLKA